MAENINLASPRLTFTEDDTVPSNEVQNKTREKPRSNSPTSKFQESNEEYEEEEQQAIGTPEHMGLDGDLPSPRSPPRSPRMTNEPSPLLLAVSEEGGDEITPVTSRDEDLVIYPDSDAGSSIRDTGRQEKKTLNGNIDNSNQGKTSKSIPSQIIKRRRRSDVSEGSNRSLRSTPSLTKESKNSQTVKIFRNLLILEQSLRNQQREQKDLRRQYTAFLAILAGLFAFASYCLFIDTQKPPSPFLKLTLRFLLFFILVTFGLFYLGGDYHRTLVIPRKFFNSTNKGLRQLNLRLVKVHITYSDTFIDYSRTFLRVIVGMIHATINHSGPFKSSTISNWIIEKLKGLEVRAQPRVGATEVKLVLNPRIFNSEIREAWELYRDEFWAKEGAKSRHLKGTEVSSINNAKFTNDSHLKSLINHQVLNKDSLLEKHRKERKDRKKGKADEKQSLKQRKNSSVSRSIDATLKTTDSVDSKNLASQKYLSPSASPSISPISSVNQN
ncbi:hypothetical protein WICMUC_002787 [Wickerhamomyces mucosus]|uniref:Sporulation-specific protein SPO7 n=1 Tax=Wickerhamomyces mucosus TaxID=1378264 RepID=A0A9P8PN72_9ASCO|nr:hypothetical protein WICMUC_002787 [Wickerhamomyces mucosus]